jgi:NDP-sugar pyrophosphorylase family protein
MKAILVCPGDRSNLSFLTESAPLTTVPILGKTLVEHWIEHVVALGAKEIEIHASDRAATVAECLGDGARWGAKISVINAAEESVPAVGLEDIAILMDRLPGVGMEDLSSGYAQWFQQALARLGNESAPRVGARQIRPGIWMGKGSVVADSATLTAPCWIGENVRIARECSIGPGAILEDFVVVERGAEITQSWVGPETFVGELIRIQDSLAWGSTLINWQTGSCITVPDAFLLSSLHRGAGLANGRSPRKVAARLQTGLLALPAQMLSSMRGKLRG